MTELPWYRKVTLAALTQNPAVIVNKYLDVTAFRYFDPDSSNVGNAGSTEFHTSGQWMGILIAVSGQPSDAISLDIESVIHWEGISKTGGLTLDRPAEPANSAVMDTTAAAGGRSNPIHVGGEQPMDVEDSPSFVAQVFNGAANAAAGYLPTGNQVGETLVSGLVNAAANYAANAGRNNGGIPGVNTNRYLTN